MAKIETSTDGPWFVWDDTFEPLAEDISYDEMKEIVDRERALGHTEVYGEDNETDDEDNVYPREQA
jgi:hypothetical protein